MNRRSFFATLGAAVAGFSILPAAKTYDRVWRAKKEWILPIVHERAVINPAWVNAPYESYFLVNDYVIKSRMEAWCVDGLTYRIVPFPKRFVLNDKTGKFDVVPPFVMQS